MTRQRKAALAGVTIGALFIFLLAWACQDADAHPLPPRSDVSIGLHRICTAIGACKDRPPRFQYGPTDPCDRGNEGEVRTIYDAKLGAQVDWQCRCLNETNCTWFRVGIRQSAYTAFWRAQPRHSVLDWQRRCASIVCKGRLVRHFYPVYVGTRLQQNLLTERTP